MVSVASQLIEEVTAHAQRDSLEDAQEICADDTYFPNNLRMFIVFYTVKTVFMYVFMTCSTSHYLCGTQKDPGNVCIYACM